MPIKKLAIFFLLKLIDCNLELSKTLTGTIQSNLNLFSSVLEKSRIKEINIQSNGMLSYLLTLKFSFVNQYKTLCNLLFCC